MKEDCTEKIQNYLQFMSKISQEMKGKRCFFHMDTKIKETPKIIASLKKEVMEIQISASTTENLVLLLLYTQTRTV